MVILHPLITTDVYIYYIYYILYDTTSDTDSDSEYNNNVEHYLMEPPQENITVKPKDDTEPTELDDGRSDTDNQEPSVAESKSSIQP